jgi:hypothetical protein
MSDSNQNPYVGPRSFTRREKDRFFGREQEARELRALILSERLVLFYAQSGAGKSSLINARLIPQLQAAGSAVLPVGRVGGELPAGVNQVENIFIFNLLLSLNQGDIPPQRFSQMHLNHFLERLTSLDGEHYYYDDSPDLAESADEPPRHVLIIDQFEELLTNHPGHWPEQAGFFRQLNQAMLDDPQLWVVLSLREDYMAAMEPYAPLLYNKMRARFYMQRMSYGAALEAIVNPAKQWGRPYAPGVAESLVDNLRQIRVQNSQGSGQAETKLGQFVEPVQLQVVCYQLWANLKDRSTASITAQDLQELGNVDIALAQFYEQGLAEVIHQTNVSEIDIRTWFETQLITESGTRGAVYRGAEQTGGLSNRVVDLLVQKFLVRAEVRGGGGWYELAHDRFVEPILQANQAWRLKQPLLQLAQAWLEAERNPSRLLEGQSLKETLASNWKGLGPLVAEFLEAGQAAQMAREKAVEAEKEAQRQRELEQARTLAEAERQRAEAQVKAARRLRWIVAALALTLMVMICLAGTAVYAFWQRQEVLASQQVATTQLPLDGRLFVSVASDGVTINVTNVINQEPLYHLTGPTSLITDIAISSDGRYLVASSQDGEVVVWALWNGQMLAKLNGHTGKVRDVTFSADGVLMATASDDGTAALWSTESWQKVMTIKSDGGPVARVAFWPSQPGFITALADGTYSIWDPWTGEKLYSGKQ